jgi:hypothetical protein
VSHLSTFFTPQHSDSLNNVLLHSTRLETSMHLAEAALIFNREFMIIKFSCFTNSIMLFLYSPFYSSLLYPHSLLR